MMMREMERRDKSKIFKEDKAYIGQLSVRES
jgi:hypothetical protein